MNDHTFEARKIRGEEKGGQLPKRSELRVTMPQLKFLNFEEIKVVGVEVRCHGRPDDAYPTNHTRIEGPNGLITTF